MPLFRAIFPHRDALTGTRYLDQGSREGWIASDYVTDGRVFLTDFFAAGNIYHRIRNLRLSGSLTLTAAAFGSPATSGNISLDLTSSTGSALGYAPITREEDLGKMGSWYGTATQADWFNNFLTVYLCSAIGAPDPDDSDQEAIAMGYSTVSFLEGGDNFTLNWGKTFPTDSCTVTLNLPATENGSFDDTGATSFSMILGGQQPRPGTGGVDQVSSGSLTLEPTPTDGFWAHDPGDGLGPHYDVNTGAYLRAKPRLPRG